MGTLTILLSGALSNVQDLGRPGYADLGISPCGAADPVSLRIGNALLGNPPGAAALEMTLVGPALRFETAARFLLMGADLNATLDEDPLPLAQPLSARPGQVLKTAAAREGCRCYLCLAGGIDVPRVLGSASTHMESRLGGIDGRRLAPGDVLHFRGKNRPPRRRTLHPDLRALLAPRKTLRITDALHTALFSPANLAAFFGASYRVSQQSSRLGIRLEGPPLISPRDVLTTGVCLGTIQITPAGQPIILFVDQQTTGGYPQIACVASVDHFRIGQLRPGDMILFEQITFDEAVRLYRAQEALLHELLA